MAISLCKGKPINFLFSPVEFFMVYRNFYRINNFGVIAMQAGERTLLPLNGEGRDLVKESTPFSCSVQDLRAKLFSRNEEKRHVGESAEWFQPCG